MTYFDFSTIYTAILTSNVLLIILALVIRSEKIMINAGYKLITIFLVLTAVRFMLPIEIPFATTVPLSQGISRIIIELFAPRFAIGTFDVSIVHLLFLIWLLGIIIHGIRFFIKNRMNRIYILTFGKNVSKEPRYVSIMNELCHDKASRLRIFEIPGLQSPLICGFVNPYILIPADLTCPDTVLNYILKHEVSHYLHKDLLIKFAVQLISIIYWWNPFGAYLNKQTSLVLEMRIDDNVAHMKEARVNDYLQSLLQIAEYQDTLFRDPMSNSISFAQSYENALTKRFLMLTRGNRKKNKVLNFLLICIVGCIYIGSYLFSFEAEYFVSDVNEYGFRFNEVDFYAIDCGDGTYQIYWEDFLLEVVDSLEYYGDDIPVYTQEELKNVQKNDLD